MFEPEPVPGDRWKWAVVATLAIAAGAVLRMRALRPFVLLVEGAVALVLLVLVVAALVKLLR